MALVGQKTTMEEEEAGADPKERDLPKFGERLSHTSFFRPPHGLSMIVNVTQMPAPSAS
jgi:hypothetical protein